MTELVYLKVVIHNTSLLSESSIHYVYRPFLPMVALYVQDETWGGHSGAPIGQL